MLYNLKPVSKCKQPKNSDIAMFWVQEIRDLKVRLPLEIDRKHIEKDGALCVNLAGKSIPPCYNTDPEIVWTHMSWLALAFDCTKFFEEL